MKEIENLVERGNELRRRAEAEIRQWKAVEPDYDQEYEVLERFFAQNHDAVGRILTCHLATDYYMEKFLVAYYGFPDLTKARLSYYQKAHLLPDTGDVGSIKLALLALNAIRNDVGHRPGADIAPKHLQQIDEVLKRIRPSESLESTHPVSRIQGFAGFACGLLVPRPGVVREKARETTTELKEIIQELSELLD